MSSARPVAASGVSPRAPTLTLRSAVELETRELVEHDVRRRRSRSTPRPLLCRRCAQPVTTDVDALVVEGSHRHRRTNPAGIAFEFGCFAAAPGAAEYGEPTDEASWFASYRWSFALCRRCSGHLGWRFHARRSVAPDTFFGLILERLVHDSGDRGAA